MAYDHYANVLNKQIELCVISEGSINWSDTENISSDELPYLIYNFKRILEEKQSSKQEFIKSILDFAGKALEAILKALSNRR
jgi:hypothetical protein